MALDLTKNFSKVTVSLGYDAAATSIVLTAGHGAKLPTAPFNAVWWNVTDYSDPSDDPNVEIVRVTNVTVDTITITRAQEGTSASTKNTATKTYRMIAGITSQMISDIQTALNGKAALSHTHPESEVVNLVSDLAGKSPISHTHAAFVASGASHAPGFVPDPGVTAGSTKYLREDGTWVTPASGGTSQWTTSGSMIYDTDYVQMGLGSNVALTQSATYPVALLTGGGIRVSDKNVKTTALGFYTPIFHVWDNNVAASSDGRETTFLVESDYNGTGTGNTGGIGIYTGKSGNYPPGEMGMFAHDGGGIGNQYRLFSVSFTTHPPLMTFQANVGYYNNKSLTWYNSGGNSGPVITFDSTDTLILGMRYSGASAASVQVFLDSSSGNFRGAINGVVGNLFYMDGSGKWAFGNNTPTAKVDIAASTTSAASLRLRSGVAPTTPNDGDVWQDGTHLYAKIGGANRQLDQQATTSNPSIKIATIFETLSRFTTSGTTAPTITTSGLNLDTGFGTGWCKCQLSVPNGRVFYPGGIFTSQFQTFTTGIIPATSVTYIGLGAPTITGSAMTFTDEHIGIKIVVASSVLNIYATCGDGTTETSTLLLGPGGMSALDSFDLGIRLNGSVTTSSVDFFLRRGSSNTTLTATISTNIPTSNSNINMVWQVENGGSGLQTTHVVSGASFERSFP